MNEKYIALFYFFEIIVLLIDVSYLFLCNLCDLKFMINVFLGVKKLIYLKKNKKIYFFSGGQNFGKFSTRESFENFFFFFFHNTNQKTFLFKR